MSTNKIERVSDAEKAQLYKLLEQGLAFHQQGQLAQAQGLYEKALAIHPENFDALHLSGIIASQTNNNQRACELICKAISVNPNNAAAYNSYGNVLRDIKQFDAALQNYDKAIALKQDYIEALINRGMVLRELKNFDSALQSYDRAIALNAAIPEVYNERGSILQDLKRFDEALQNYDKAIALKSNFVAAYNNRGNLFKELKQFDAALRSYDKAISLKADYAEGYNNRGNVLLELKRFDEALQNYDKAISLKTNYAQGYYNRGKALFELEQFDAAIKSYDQAIALKADYAKSYNNRGNALRRLGMLDAALQSYDKAIAVKSDFVDGYNNRGCILQEMGQAEAALQSFNQALALNPNDADTRLNLGMYYLQLGNFTDGWSNYEWRLKTKDGMAGIKSLPKPQWAGESLQNKIILLRNEQGLGDTIQFCRYAKLFKDLGAKVILEVQPPLVSLLAGLDGVAQIIPHGAPLPAFDYYCYLLSLPAIFKTDLSNIPASSFYIKSNSAKVQAWQTKLGQKLKPRVGLVWSGNKKFKNDHNRSMRFTEIESLLSLPYQFVCLQKELNDLDKEPLRAHPEVLYFGDELEDFTDTAALCELVDVVVSTDTSVAHLAGAMGKEVWILLPYNPDWRWLLERSDSPWYPSAKLYRQSQRGNWKGILDIVSQDLKRRLGGC